MLIAATHTHTAPAAMACLGTRANQAYADTLKMKIADAIAEANSRLVPARFGWTRFEDWDHTHTRRWILRPDKQRTDPFGNVSVRASMHPGYQNPDAITESGPVDPGFSILAFQTEDGSPLAAVANYSQHYFGSTHVSADYHGLFAESLASRMGGPAVVLFSQGTSGDQQWMDYSQPKSAITLEAYARALVDRAAEAWKTIRYNGEVTLSMEETTLRLARRAPDTARLAWARGIIAAMRPGPPRNQQEVYAHEAIFLHREPERELRLQAIRIGEAGITAIPNEVYAITGLKLKARSPLPFTVNITLANGAEGYIPPPEQHRFGGYTTWPARTAGLEESAEPRIVAALLGLLENVSGRRRRFESDPETAYTSAVLASRPWAYWRLDEMEGNVAYGTLGYVVQARYEGRIAFYLPGIEGPSTHAAYFAGGRLRLQPVAPLGPVYSVEAWFWPGIGKTAVFGAGLGLAPRQWHHVVLVRRERRSTLYVNGKPESVALEGAASVGEGFEGKIDEVAIYRRELVGEEIRGHLAAARAGH
jgi:hypothetical protein